MSNDLRDEPMTVRLMRKQVEEHNKVCFISYKDCPFWKDKQVIDYIDRLKVKLANDRNQS